MRISYRLALLAAIATLSACDGDAVGTVSRAMEGTITGNVIAAGPDARCASPAVLITASLAGSVAPLGLSTSAQSHCLDPSTGALTDGRFVLSGPNGTLSGTYSGTLGAPSDGEAPFAGSFAVTGGTGTYGDAAGTGGISAYQNTSSGALVATFSGSVRF